MNNMPTLNQVHEYLIDLVRQRRNPITYTQLAQHFEMEIADDTDMEFWTSLFLQCQLERKEVNYRPNQAHG